MGFCPRKMPVVGWLNRSTENSFFKNTLLPVGLVFSDTPPCQPEVTCKSGITSAQQQEDTDNKGCEKFCKFNGLKSASCVHVTEQFPNSLNRLQLVAMVVFIVIVRFSQSISIGNSYKSAGFMPSKLNEGGRRTFP